MGFISSGYTGFECISQCSKCSSFHAAGIAVPLLTHCPGSAPVQLHTRCHSTALEIMFAPVQLHPGMYDHSTPCSSVPWGQHIAERRPGGALSSPQRSTAPSVALEEPQMLLCCFLSCIRMFISSLLAMYLLQYLWGWAPEQEQTQSGSRLSLLQPRSRST